MLGLQVHLPCRLCQKCCAASRFWRALQRALGPLAQALGRVQARVPGLVQPQAVQVYWVLRRQREIFS